MEEKEKERMYESERRTKWEIERNIQIYSERKAEEKDRQSETDIVREEQRLKEAERCKGEEKDRERYVGRKKGGERGGK